MIISVIKPSVEILDNIDGEEMLKKIELAGRTCYKSEERITEKSAVAFVAARIKQGHESILEHEKVTVRVICDRGVSHQLVRHRIASYSQESTRYCDYNKWGKVTFILPPWCKNILPGVYSEAYISKIMYDTLEKSAERMWLWGVYTSANHYAVLREKGWPPEQARTVLPNSLKTEIVITQNLRSWRHFFRERTALAAHPQMREIALPLLNLFHQKLPVVFDDFFKAKGVE